MFCKSCHSENQREFRAEIAIHFPGLKGLTKSLVLVSSTLLVCMKCGFTEFVVPETERAPLVDGDAA
jgi:hypothetical protein